MRKIILLVFALALTISACVPQDSGSSTRTSSGAGTSYGVDVSFVPGVPSDRFYVEEGLTKNANFEVAVELTNRGEYPKTDIGSLHGRLYLTGFDPSIVRSRRWDGSDQFTKISGVSSSYPEGGSKQKSFIADEIYFPSQSREYPISLVLNACYYYETHATATVCVDPDPRSRSDEQACLIGDVRLDRHKAPLQIRDVRQSATSNELEFTIGVSNVGNGKVLTEFGGQGVISDGNCLNPGFDERDRIAVEASVTGLPSGVCSPTGSTNEPLRLFDGRGEIVCRFPIDRISAESAYTTQMSIKLRYGYHVSERKEVTLVNTARS